MSWGYRIAVFYIVFVIAIVTLVFMASRQQMDLVEKDYYEQELVYQKRIAASRNANLLSSQVSIRHTDNKLVLILPEEMNGIPVKADLLLYCPSNAANDKQYSLLTATGILEAGVPIGISGLYMIKLNWFAKGSHYYFENNYNF